MIKDSIDFDYAIDKITTKIEPNIIHQGEILESDKFNMTFKEIEDSLNTLYEKTRYLEDAIQYARVFLETKIRNFNNEMDAIIKELESNLEMTKNLSYISYNVPLNENVVALSDRDITLNKLTPLIKKNKVLTLGYESDLDIAFSSVKRISDSIPYDDDLQYTTTNKSYKVIYLEEQLMKNGLTETLVIYFPDPVIINTLDFAMSNSQVKNIRFGLINGIEEYASDYTMNNINKSRSCIYVKFDLVCNNYNTIVYQIDKNKMTDNLWNDLKEFEIAKTTNLDKVSKLNTEYIISRTTINKLTGKTIKESYSPDSNHMINVTMYSYVFGLDKLNFKYVKPQTTGYFISDYITIGELTENEYINLYVSEVKDRNACIEYSILDGEKEIPVIPVNYDIVENEPIFSTMDLRFKRDKNITSEQYVQEIIKKDGQLTNITYEDALTKQDGNYTITYKPDAPNHDIHGLMNESIRVKCYIRTFGTNIKDISYIDMITIRKYGEETLWTNKY